MGNRSLEVVRCAEWRFADRRGYLYCPACFVVWNGLPVARAITQDAPTAEPADPYTRLGSTPAWIPGEGGARYRRLHEVQRGVNTSFTLVARGHEALRRAGDRLRDADVICEALGLPADVRDAVSFHLTVASRRVRFRTLANRVREEAFTLATVALVMERFGVARSEAEVMETVRFRDGNTLRAEEYARAKRALHAWYEENLWRSEEPRHE